MEDEEVAAVRAASRGWGQLGRGTGGPGSGWMEEQGWVQQSWPQGMAPTWVGLGVPGAQPWVAWQDGAAACAGGAGSSLALAWLPAWSSARKAPSLLVVAAAQGAGWWLGWDSALGLKQDSTCVPPASPGCPRGDGPCPVSLPWDMSLGQRARGTSWNSDKGG